MRAERAEGGRVMRSLLADGTLHLDADGEVWPEIAHWVPRMAAEVGSAGPAPAVVRVARGAHSDPLPAGEPPVRLCDVGGWPDRSGRMRLATPDGSLHGVADPAAGRAEVRLAPGAADAPDHGVQVSAALTLAAATLLGRMGRTLIHAAAVVAPDGRAWLLPSGTFGGKTTTCVNLIGAGWDYLSDDHVVVGRDGGGIAVEGWPRRFNLDTGYAAGASVGVRTRVDPDRFGPGRWRRRAPLGGLLFPRVEAGLPTALASASRADALSALLPQSPWLLADPPAAASLLALLRAAAELPAFRLRLGADTYRDGARLARVLAPAVAPDG